MEMDNIESIRRIDIEWSAETYLAHISAPPFSSSFRIRLRCARTAADSLLLLDDFSALTASAECSGLDTFRFT